MPSGAAADCGAEEGKPVLLGSARYAPRGRGTWRRSSGSDQQDTISSCSTSRVERSRSARAPTTTLSSTPIRPSPVSTPGSNTSGRPGASRTSDPPTAPPSTGAALRPSHPARSRRDRGSVALASSCASPTARSQVATAPLRAPPAGTPGRAAGAGRAVPTRAVGPGLHPAVVGAGDRRRPVRDRVGGEAAPGPALRQVRHPPRDGRITSRAARQRGDPAAAVTMLDLQASAGIDLIRRRHRLVRSPSMVISATSTAIDRLRAAWNVRPVDTPPTNAMSAKAITASTAIHRHAYAAVATVSTDVTTVSRRMTQITARCRPRTSSTVSIHPDGGAPDGLVVLGGVGDDVELGLHVRATDDRLEAFDTPVEAELEQGINIAERVVSSTDLKLVDQLKRLRMCTAGGRRTAPRSPRRRWRPVRPAGGRRSSHRPGDHRAGLCPRHLPTWCDPRRRKSKAAADPAHDRPQAAGRGRPGGGRRQTAKTPRPTRPRPWRRACPSASIPTARTADSAAESDGERPECFEDPGGGERPPAPGCLSPLVAGHEQQHPDDPDRPPDMQQPWGRGDQSKGPADLTRSRTGPPDVVQDLLGPDQVEQRNEASRRSALPPLRRRSAAPSAGRFR